MEKDELMQKVKEYTYYLTDEYLEEVCKDLLQIKDANLFFEKCYENDAVYTSESPCSFICDSVTHSHKYRELILKKYENDCIYKFCEKMLFDSSYIRRREALIIICDTLNIHRITCKKILEDYFIFVIENDPLLLYDYIMEFTWLYAYEIRIKRNLYSKILKLNNEYANLILLETLDDLSIPLFSSNGLLKYKILSKLARNQNRCVNLFAKKMKKNMIIRNYKKKIDTKKYILGNGRLEFSNIMFMNKTENYNKDDFINFYLNYVKKNF